MMDPEAMRDSWRQILNRLRDTYRQRRNEYQATGYETLKTQLAAESRMKDTEKAYEAALNACLDGQDPLMWKLSYNDTN